MDTPIERLSIAGQRVAPHSGNYYEDSNPADSQVLARIAEGDAADVNTAVEAAIKAQREWSSLPTLERRAVLMRLAEAIDRNKGRLATLDSQDAGKPIRLVRKFDVPQSSRVLGYYANLIDTEDPAIADAPPFGIAGIVVPSNYPLVLLTYYLAPALAARNAVIVKPSPEAPRSALYLADLAKEAGLPDGLINVITGGSNPARAIVEHPDIHKIAFTGGTETGRTIEMAARPYQKSLTLELGGKSPMIVCADAVADELSLQEVIATIYDAVFLNTGQLCTAASRLLIEHEVYERVVGHLVKYAKEKERLIGPPSRLETELGPLIAERYLQTTLGYAERARKDGATYAHGGIRLQEGEFAKGHFMTPVIFTWVPDNSPLAQEEVFGPVLAVLEPFNTLEEAVQRANNSRYGLAAGIQTTDPAKVRYAYDNLEVGTVWVGKTYNRFSPEMPFGGRKDSGHGAGLGREGFFEFVSGGEKSTVHSLWLPSSMKREEVFGARAD